MSIKNKLRAGITFLFLMALIAAGLAAYYLNRLSADSKDILKDNYRTLIYTKNISEALDNANRTYTVATQTAIIEKNLIAQEHNITERGERELTGDLRLNFERYKTALSRHEPTSTYSNTMKNLLYGIMQLNMAAIERKDKTAANTANTAVIIVSFIGSLCFLIAFTFMINFPGYIANPIAELTQGIKAIAGKDYKKRIAFSAKDEFGELADAFNQMARQLDIYENSSLASILLEKKRIETIINSMHDAIIGLDDKMFIVFVNKVACNLMGISEEKLVGEYAPDIALENDLLRNILHADQTRMKIFADNRESYFTREVLDVVNENTSTGKVIILKNITEFQQLDEAKTNFIATISHELKTPISAIKMSLKLLEDDRIGAINAEQKQLLQNIEDDARRLLQITGELLDMAQIETGKIQLNFGSTHPQNIVNYAVQAIRFIADQKNISIQVDCPDTLPTVRADLDKSTWVLLNLLSNAIKYSPEKSTVKVSVQRASNNSIQFSVKDHGQGIDARYLSRIFERYFKVPGGSPDKTGTGLGLAIAKDFIEAQGGSINVESEIGDGSKFYFLLPVG
ncbi:PAS domain-containing sensor histidine kinase [Mucilaginibacter sp. PPCGB 2223]|uniref:HAMP domain-containing sensor histidine kinase n=1 Tax=Mucilaginibacter sp. PPCGB 2223 TaxID=1886027 RepID=UPI00082530A5|nr:ATP-binding protein [Mucilaginibacter sp. PPCGB 2223]OCX52152.1 PAS domain-containing sensor histidine kinase [Mucilaginibacter sp. PPCGB 2223]